MNAFMNGKVYKVLGHFYRLRVFNLRSLDAGHLYLSFDLKMASQLGIWGNEHMETLKTGKMVKCRERS